MTASGLTTAGPTTTGPAPAEPATRPASPDGPITDAAAPDAAVAGTVAPEHRRDDRGRGTTRRRRYLRPAVARWISPALVLAAWAAASGTGLVDPLHLPSPLSVAAAGRRVIADGTLAEALAVSLDRVLVGLLIGLGTGLAAGLVVGLTRAGELALDPPLQMLRTLPLLGLTPLLILWLGIGEAPKIVLVAVGVLFPVYLNTVGGIHAVDPRLLEAGRVLGLNRHEVIRHVVLPSALPHLLVGLRQSLGIAWISLIVGEQINASSGLGHLINDAREYLQTDLVLVGLLVYALLGLLTDAAVRLLERKALTWRS